MADNTSLNMASGGDVIRTIAKTATGAKVQTVLLDIGGGTDASVENILTAGPQTSANSLSVAFATDMATGTPSQSGRTVGIASASLVTAGQFGNFIRVKVPLEAANGIYVRWDGGNAVVNDGVSEYLAPGDEIVWSKMNGFLPTCTINAIAPVAVAVILIGA